MKKRGWHPGFSSSVRHFEERKKGPIGFGSGEKGPGKDGKREGKVLRHPDAFAIRTDPGGTVADAPFVFLKTGIAYLETAGTTPTEHLFFLAAMTLVFAEFSLAIAAAGAAGVLLGHARNSPFNQSR